MIYDWENRWAIDEFQGFGRPERRAYAETCLAHYRPFWSRGIPVDVISENADFSPYKLVVAPMLYMLLPGVAERLKQCVAAGGALVTTYISGIADESDLCFLGGWPGGGLREVFGIWNEDTDTLVPTETNTLRMEAGNTLGLAGSYELRDYCALIHAEGAEVLAAYGADFYAGQPALTANHFGAGRAYYMAARASQDFLSDFYGKLAGELNLLRALPVDLPEGVTAQLRENGQHKFAFVMNFNPAPASVPLGAGSYHSLLSGAPVSGQVDLPAFGVEVLQY
jgi:beta-galactosidase